MRTLCLVAACLLAACQRSGPPQAGAPAPPAAGAHTVQPGNIEWFSGDLDAAFAVAAAEHKPVFLYWGAEWCPPCHDLKAHVFSRSDFQQKLRQFVPVYLDGDAEGAQRIGAEFNVMGYPTVVVLRPDRTEVARIAGGMDLGSYADVLDVALEGVRPLPEVLESLRGDASRALTLADCRRMAYNGWRLDPRADADAGALVESLQLAQQRCPPDATAERDRLLATAASLAASTELNEIEAGRPASPRLRALVGSVQALLSDRERRIRVADALIDLGDDFFAVARRVDAARTDELRRNWFALMDAMETDPAYSDTVKLMSAAGRLYAAKALDAKGVIPPDVLARARATLDAFLARKYDPDARAGIVNSASWVLEYLGDDARLRELLQGELATSRTPFYYMADLAALAERTGNEHEALTLLERAYRESQGPATRFQWGVLFVEGLLRMSPQDEPRIRAATIAVLGELAGPDRIHARTRGRLERMHKALLGWSSQSGRSATLAAINQHWQQICSALPATDAMRGECPRLMAAGRT
ncbi:MAG TPA: thioredoxin family protein [Steroidobacteraceae bacterium]|nr:thioredoxin family protein [Steroidobacteraceae bacterium]